MTTSSSRRPIILVAIALVVISIVLYTHMSTICISLNINQREQGKSQMAKVPCNKGEPNLDSLMPELHIYKRENDCNRTAVLSNRCVTLKGEFGQAPICIYNPEEDIWISKLLAKAGYWEPDFMNTITRYLKQDKSMSFLDIGCNIGVFTIMAAKMGHNVVCVDANINNLRLVGRSLELGGLQDRVTLVWNALGQTRGGISLQPVDKNVGGAFVKEKAEKIDAHSILLDDLNHMFGQEKVFIKMDVEGYEWNVLQGGQNFFRIKQVPIVFMEWVFHIQKPQRGSMIMDYMTKLQYVAYHPVDTAKKLNPKDGPSWPWETVWVKS